MRWAAHSQRIREVLGNDKDDEAAASNSTFPPLSEFDADIEDNDLDSNWPQLDETALAFVAREIHSAPVSPQSSPVRLRVASSPNSLRKFVEEEEARLANEDDYAENATLLTPLPTTTDDVNDESTWELPLLVTLVVVCLVFLQSIS